MKKIAIVYASHHQGNTRRLVEALARELPVTLFDADITPEPDLAGFDAVGFASGIDFGKFYPPVSEALVRSLPQGIPVFFLYTCAKPSARFTASMEQAAAERSAPVLGAYSCRGFNTYGPLKLIGGMNKGHPTEAEFSAARTFVSNILEK